MMNKPNYHEMSLVELKQHAKNHQPKIKKYYIMPRHELIQILSMNELPEEMVVAKRTIEELRVEIRKLNLPNINLWKLKRCELVEILYPSTKKNYQNDYSGKEHNDPQKSDRNQVGVNVLKDAC
jgi:hypothetical protein